VGPSKREAREWKPPLRGGSAPAARASAPAEDEPEPAKSPSRPSKDDLAALDALLNSKALEGPLQPMERPAPDRWSPQFGARPGGARPVGGSSRAVPLLAAVVLLAAAAGGAWYYLGRPQTDASADAAGSAPATVAEGLTPSEPPLTAPTAPASTLAAGRPTAATRATPAPPVRTPPPATPPPAGRPSPAAATPGLREAREMLASGELAGAARGFAANLRTAPAGAASVQLLIACSDATVQKAVSSVNSPELYIVPVKYQGRDCYRLLWGVYSNATQAAAAARSVPEYFRKNGAAPRVMSASELRP
jgi:septal ring-binding cell division protein DamX